MSFLPKISPFIVFITLLLPGLASSQQNGNNYIQKADSLFVNQDYKKAKLLFEKLLSDNSRDAFHLNRLGFCEYSAGNFTIAEKYYKQALASNPPPPVKASILSRLARITALKNQPSEASAYLDSAINSGYFALQELDTLKDFNSIRTNLKFKQVRERLYNSLYPCMNDPHSREFDFWIGDWDVYSTGTQTHVGNSMVQKISGGCAILENWSSPLSEGKSLNYVDDSSNKWKQDWVGSYSGGKQTFVNGEYKDSAMRFYFESKDAQGKKTIGRFTFFNQGPIQVRQLNETSSNGGQSWQVNYDFTYIRKKK